MQICPSILEYKAEDYLLTIKKLSPYYKYLQIDFSDGVYVNSKTAGLDDFIKIIDPVTFNGLTLDFHLMVKEYETYLTKLEALKKIINIKNVFIHYDLSPKYEVVTAKYTFPIGLVLNPQDQIDDLSKQYNLNNISCVQIMSVIPGAQGKPFMPETLNKIEQLRLLDYRKEIFLDGAVNDKTIPLISSLKHRPDFICPGSFLAKTDKLKEHVDYLLEYTHG